MAGGERPEPPNGNRTVTVEFLDELYSKADQLAKFLAAVDAVLADEPGGHDSYVRVGAVFFEHERELRA